MYDWLPEVCRDIRANIIGIYWLSIVPLTLLLIVLEFFKLPEREPDVLRIIKRAAISMILLMSFDEVMGLIAAVGDGIVNRISPTPHINQVLDEVWKFVQDIELSWHKFKEAIIWIFSLLSFIFVYLGAFISDALVHFCWAILFVMSPLMILAYIPESTAQVTKGLYRGLCVVMIWKILWIILGVILLKLTTHAPIANGEDYNSILLIVINLFIGASMLFIPIATKSFLSSDFAAFSGGLAVVPAIAGKKLLLNQLKRVGKYSSDRGQRVASYGLSLTGRAFRDLGKYARLKRSDLKRSQAPSYFKKDSLSHRLSFRHDIETTLKNTARHKNKIGLKEKNSPLGQTRKPKGGRK